MGIANKFVTSAPISLNYSPEVGLSPFEVLAGGSAYHPGTSINNLVDVSGKSKNEIFDVVRSLDPRALSDMPSEVLGQIESGNIQHIFTTDPTKSGRFMDLTDAERTHVSSSTKGSVYFRTREGQTARWKLPEISTSDARWAANQGSGIFSTQTVFMNEDDAYSMAKTEGLKKSIANKGLYKASEVDPVILKTSVMQDIIDKKSSTIGMGEVFFDNQADAARQAVLGAGKKAQTTAKSTPKINIGTPTAHSTSAPSRTVLPKAGTESVSAPGPYTPPRTFASGSTPGSAKIVTQDPNLPKATVRTATEMTGVAQTTASAASSGAPAKGFINSIRDELSAGVLKSKNLKLLGLGALVGAGGYGINKRRRTAEDNMQRRLEMQRNGIYRSN